MASFTVFACRGVLLIEMRLWCVIHAVCVFMRISMWITVRRAILSGAAAVLLWSTMVAHATTAAVVSAQ